MFAEEVGMGAGLILGVRKLPETRQRCTLDKAENFEENNMSHASLHKPNQLCKTN